MIVIYCYLEKEKDILKFRVNKSADFGEEQHTSTKPSTIICSKCLRWALPKIGLKVVIYCQDGVTISSVAGILDEPLVFSMLSK